MLIKAFMPKELHADCIKQWFSLGLVTIGYTITIQMILMEQIVPETEPADLSLILSQALCLSSEARHAFNAPLFTYEFKPTCIYTHARAQRDSHNMHQNLPSSLLNAKWLSNKLRHRCTITHPIMCNYSHAYVTKVPSKFILNWLEANLQVVC